MKMHRWSGWPGAICLDCFQEDQLEQCIADHDVSITCVEGHVMCDQGHAMQVCPEHINGPCLAKDSQETPLGESVQKS